jgi:putative tricarboxylic transport membrane protein
VKTQRAADRALAVGAVVLGAVVLGGARGIERQAGEGLTPRAFPIAIALALLASGAAVAATSKRRTAGEAALDWPGREGFRRIAVVVAATVAYVLSLDAAGLPVASALFVTALGAYLGRGAWISAAAAGAGAGVVLYVVFIRLLGLALPSGPLP